MYPDPTITAPASFQVAAMTPLQLKVIDSSSGKKYQLHVMDASYEVEVHCGQATKPVMHNHDGLHALHCEK
ncbi:MAG: hypothetical protein HC835_07425 [Oscillatoriales cyanobacterium RM2_1_1]|nr:hypothetical protein [Oscillatoriales cyanobacterium RM2_1_1]